jgi:hypothetical protein
MEHLFPNASESDVEGMPSPVFRKLENQAQPHAGRRRLGDIKTLSACRAAGDRRSITQHELSSEKSYAAVGLTLAGIRQQIIRECEPRTRKQEKIFSWRINVTSGPKSKLWVSALH